MKVIMMAEIYNVNCSLKKKSRRILQRRSTPIRFCHAASSYSVELCRARRRYKRVVRPSVCLSFTSRYHLATNGYIGSPVMGKILLICVLDTDTDTR